MFVKRSTYDQVVTERDGSRIVVEHQARAIKRLQAEVEHLHAAQPVRGARGKFQKREQVA